MARKKSKEENTQIDKMHHHEALHTSFIIQSMISEFLCDHPAVQSCEKRSVLAAKAMNAVGELYQLIGSDMI